MDTMSPEKPSALSTSPVVMLVPPVMPKPKKPRLSNPVKNALVKKTAKEYLDPELEAFLALLAECL